MECSYPREAEIVTRRPGEETDRLGDEIYKRDIRQQVEADHHGAVVATDVDSGSWVVSDTVIAATDGLCTQRPDAADVWLLGVGISHGITSAAAPAERRVIEGVGNAAHAAVVPLALNGSVGQTRDFEAVIDAGFTGLTGFLTMTPALAGELGSNFRGNSGRP